MKFSRRQFLTLSAVIAAGASIEPLSSQTPLHNQLRMKFAQSNAAETIYDGVWHYPFCAYDGQPVRGAMLMQTAPVTRQEAQIATEEINRRTESFKTLFENLYRQQKTEEGFKSAQSHFDKLLGEIRDAINARTSRTIGIEFAPLPFQPQPDLKCTLG